MATYAEHGNDTPLTRESPRYFPLSHLYIQPIPETLDPLFSTSPDTHMAHAAISHPKHRHIPKLRSGSLKSVPIQQSAWSVRTEIRSRFPPLLKSSITSPYSSKIQTTSQSQQGSVCSDSCHPLQAGFRAPPRSTRQPPWAFAHCSRPSQQGGALQTFLSTPLLTFLSSGVSNPFLDHPFSSDSPSLTH